MNRNIFRSVILVLLFVTDIYASDSFPIWFSTKEPDCAIGISPSMDDSIKAREISIMIANLSIGLSKHIYNKCILIKESYYENGNFGIKRGIKIMIRVPKISSIEKDTILPNGSIVNLVRYKEQLSQDSMLCIFFKNKNYVQIDLQTVEKHLNIKFYDTNITDVTYATRADEIKLGANVSLGGIGTVDINNACYGILYELLSRFEIYHPNATPTIITTLEECNEETRGRNEFVLSRDSGSAKSNMCFLIGESDCIVKVSYAP